MSKLTLLPNLPPLTRSPEVARAEENERALYGMTIEEIATRYLPLFKDGTFEFSAEAVVHVLNDALRSMGSDPVVARQYIAQAKWLAMFGDDLINASKGGR